MIFILILGLALLGTLGCITTLIYAKKCTKNLREPWRYEVRYDAVVANMGPSWLILEGKKEIVLLDSTEEQAKAIVDAHNRAVEKATTASYNDGWVSRARGTSRGYIG